MPIWLLATGKWGSVLAIIALIITLLKQIIAFIGFLTIAIKVLVVLAFVIVFIGVAFLVFKGISSYKKSPN